MLKADELTEGQLIVLVIDYHQSWDNVPYYFSCIVQRITKTRIYVQIATNDGTSDSIEARMRQLYNHDSENRRWFRKNDLESPKGYKNHSMLSPTTFLVSGDDPRLPIWNERRLLIEKKHRVRKLSQNISETVLWYMKPREIEAIELTLWAQQEIIKAALKRKAAGERVC